MSSVPDQLHGSKKPVALGTLTMTVDALMAGVKKLLAERDARIADLEARIKKLEKQGGEAR